MSGANGTNNLDFFYEIADMHVYDRVDLFNKLTSESDFFSSEFLAQKLLGISKEDIALNKKLRREEQNSYYGFSDEEGSDEDDDRDDTDGDRDYGD